MAKQIWAARSTWLHDDGTRTDLLQGEWLDALHREWVKEDRWAVFLTRTDPALGKGFLVERLHTYPNEAEARAAFHALTIGALPMATSC
jgi:hypothetical protein